jgi:hypothetical protein
MTSRERLPNRRTAEKFERRPPSCATSAQSADSSMAAWPKSSLAMTTRGATPMPAQGTAR